MTFAEGARAENGGQALAALPNGAYWLVRCSLPSSPGIQLQLGNDAIPLPPFADEVLNRRDFYAAAFGASVPPSYERPLVGILVLAWTGNDMQDALLCFDVDGEPSRSSAAAQTRTGDAVFVITTDPTFVVDSLADFRQLGGHGERRLDVDLLVRRFVEAR
jgi:hypothetical protein